MTRPLNRSNTPPSGLPGSPVKTNLTWLVPGDPLAISHRISSLTTSEPCDVPQTLTVCPRASWVRIALLRFWVPKAADWFSVKLPSWGVNGQNSSGVDSRYGLGVPGKYTLPILASTAGGRVVYPGPLTTSVIGLTVLGICVTGLVTAGELSCSASVTALRSAFTLASSVVW